VANKKRSGRPTKTPTPGERVPLGLRVTADLKRRLDLESEKSGRSQSHEVEYRLERSLSLDSAFESPALRDLIVRLAVAFDGGGRSAAYSQNVEGDWTRDPHCYRAAMMGVFEKLIAESPDAALALEDLDLQIVTLKKRIEMRLSQRERRHRK
jgi:TraY domain-containing protein